MKANEIRAMTESDLEAAVEAAYQELFNLRFQQTTGRLADTSRVRQVRREMARLKTVARERELWAAYESFLEEGK